MEQEIILKAQNICKYFPLKKGLLNRHVADIKAVDDVSFEVQKGDILGVVGESGCGKSTLGRTIIRLYPPTSGKVMFDGEDFTSLTGEQLRAKRKQIQMIFQDPYASLDPRRTVGHILAQPFKIHKMGNKQEIKDRVMELLKTTGLDPVYVNRYPHEFSGGQRQRIAIARSIALNPGLIIADEPVSALDASIQAQILNLLKDLGEKMGLTYIFISHDLTVVEYLCNKIAVMYLGKIVEIGPRDELFTNPKHPYTQALMESIPKIGQGKKTKRVFLTGEVPSPINPPSGCTFHPRCKHKMPKCSQQTPSLITTNNNNDHQVACYLEQ
ncbi:MAG: dipeptide ABC transporter ATP-binding protein [Bacteriovoracaceae bacterium]|nr:dipeptide ABC transporter ATP-binding protein [Bacteriovoracaceae bacterium]